MSLAPFYALLALYTLKFRLNAPDSNMMSMMINTIGPIKKPIKPISFKPINIAISVGVD